MITAHALSVSKGDTTVMSVDSFESLDGGITGIVGPSGCGKSTLLNCLGLLEAPAHGTVTVDGVDLSAAAGRPRRMFWRDRAAFVFQDYGIIPDWSVAENVTLRSGSLAARAADARRAQEVLERVGLAGKSSERAGRLSGGEKQRVGIARALYKKAAYIFADEPTASLDAANRQTVIALLRQAADDGASVIVATHDEDMIQACDALVRLTRPTVSESPERPGRGRRLRG